MLIMEASNTATKSPLRRKLYQLHQHRLGAKNVTIPHVHRRTGGLETIVCVLLLLRVVHRRTGGSERLGHSFIAIHNVHRRTGGIENKLGL